MDGDAPGMEDLPPNARRVQAALVAAGCRGQVRALTDSTRTSAEAAAALGAETAQIAKSVVLVADGRPVVVLMSGSQRVATAALAATLGVAHVQKASADEVKEATGYPIGGVSPAGLPAGLEVLVDKGLARHEIVWAAAGTPHAVYPTNFIELLKLTGGRPVEVAEAT
ncbi:MAG TPA: YbaK/EbsC family protein [Acidimicrobiales bacterium]|nr:YbaK/EbsC family protein [Acidimicrobiales bacterium]